MKSMIKEQMMKIKQLGYFSLIVLILMSACGPAEVGAGFADRAEGIENKTSAAMRLEEGYDDALSVQAQLAVGTLMLEGTDLAVDESMAGELLPLWRAVLTLRDSDTAALEEIEAVLNQIQGTMEPEQLTAIAEMRLTAASLASLQEEGALALGPGDFEGRDANAEEVEEGGLRGGGFPGGGGFTGGVPGGGPGDPEGSPGGLDPEALATRQAAFAQDGAGSMRERAMTAALVRLLATRSGDRSSEQSERAIDLALSLAGEATGLSLEEIQSQLAEGMTLAEIVDSNGGDVEKVERGLIEALGELPDMAEADLEALASRWLGLGE